MTTAHTLRRSLIVGLAALGIAFALTNSASADNSSVPNDVVVVSSTVAGTDLFTMTVTNLGEVAVDLDLAPPGDVSDVSVDFGSYNGHWMILEMPTGGTATMTGLLAL